MHYKLRLSCKFKPRIRVILRRLSDLLGRRDDLTSRYAGLKKDLNFQYKSPVAKKAAKQEPAAPKAYKAVKGDPIDELWAQHLKNSQLSVPFVRLSPGKYQFGSKNIICKIINGKLFVRVGGGYTTPEDFLA